jgi:hypothetical protein
MKKVNARIGGSVGIFLGVLALVAILSLKLDRIRKTDPISSRSAPGDERFDNASTHLAPLNIPTAQEISKAMAERQELIKISPEDYYDPNRKSAGYRKRVHYHQSIRTFQSSSRYSDPSFRGIMTLLLEHGYGPNEWFRVVNVLRSTMTPAMMHNEMLERDGFSESEIEQELARPGSGLAMYHQALKRGGPQKLIAASARIEEQKLIDELVRINFLELGVRSNEKLLTQSAQFLSPGDRLLTDSDWMDDEFREAEARYNGELKGDFEARFPVFLKNGSHVLHQNASGE